MTTPHYGQRHPRSNLKPPLVKQAPATIALLHATRGRPEKAVQAMRLWAAQASNPRAIEYIRAMDNDDPAAQEIVGATDARFQRCAQISVEPRGSAPAWNEAYKCASGKLLVQMSDDFEPVKSWDALLLEKLRGYSLDAPIVVAVSDGFRKDRLLTMLVCTRAYAELEGCFLNPAYASVHSDGEASFRAYKLAVLGLVTVIEARDLVFEHRHHWRDASVPWDKTYADQNSGERYEAGSRMFSERNPGWEKAIAMDGEPIVNWL